MMCIDIAVALWCEMVSGNTLMRSVHTDVKQHLPYPVGLTVDKSSHKYKHVLPVANALALFNFDEDCPVTNGPSPGNDSASARSSEERRKSFLGHLRARIGVALYTRASLREGMKIQSAATRGVLGECKSVHDLFCNRAPPGSTPPPPPSIKRSATILFFICPFCLTIAQSLRRWYSGISTEMEKLAGWISWKAQPLHRTLYFWRALACV